VSAFGRRARIVIGVLGAWSLPAYAQNAIGDVKNPLKAFATVCAECHPSAQGLAKNPDASSLNGFLRQHYTTGPEMSATMAAYLLSVAKGGRAERDPTASQNGAGTRRGHRPVAEPNAEETPEAAAPRSTVRRQRPERAAPNEAGGAESDQGGPNDRRQAATPRRAAGSSAAGQQATTRKKREEAVGRPAPGQPSIPAGEPAGPDRSKAMDRDAPAAANAAIQSPPEKSLDAAAEPNVSQSPRAEPSAQESAPTVSAPAAPVAPTAAAAEGQRGFSAPTP
jgi:hypothetical protein